MSEALIQIVDEHDVPTGSTTMDEAQRQALWHRIALVMVCNEKNEMLLQLRNKDAFTYPNCWDLSVGGHVDSGEDYLQAALREAQEEIGVSLTELTEIDYYKRASVKDGRTYNRFFKTFKALVPSSAAFYPDPKEVAELRWFSRPEVEELVKTKPRMVTDGLENFLKHSAI